jgi:hypothetical protein
METGYTSSQKVSRADWVEDPVCMGTTPKPGLCILSLGKVNMSSEFLRFKWGKCSWPLPSDCMCCEQ